MVKRFANGESLKFKDYLAGKGMGSNLSKKKRSDLLHQYLLSKGGQLGQGIKKTSGNLLRALRQSGGGWSDFTDFFTKTIPSAFKSAAEKARDIAGEVGNRAKQFGKFAYEKGIKPAY